MPEFAQTQTSTNTCTMKHQYLYINSQASVGSHRHTNTNTERLHIQTARLAHAPPEAKSQRRTSHLLVTVFAQALKHLSSSHTNINCLYSPQEITSDAQSSTDFQGPQRLPASSAALFVPGGGGEHGPGVVPMFILFRMFY